ncbi:MAG TPA: hypothetical protein PLW65_33140, partial [Pseudomonadota bacterium]|nr:hypothetical protein [Pseudomonadota bacterium]
GDPSREEDVWLICALKRRYRPALHWCLRHAGLVRFVSLGVTIPALALALALGTDFMPELDEAAPRARPAGQGSCGPPRRAPA